jgi:hypothetical protein
MNIIAQIPTYGPSCLCDPQRARTILKHLLIEGLPLLNDHEQTISKKDILANPLEKLTAAADSLTGHAVITLTAKPETWTDILTKGTSHPLLQNWTQPKYEYQTHKQFWLQDTPTRFLWHVKTGLICASKAPFSPQIFVSFHQLPDVKIFPWKASNLAKT